MSRIKSKIIRNAGWNYVSYLIPIAISLPVLGIIARLLGVELFGLFTLMFTLFGYAGIFDLGFSRALVRTVSINRENINEINNYLYTAVLIVLIVSIAPFLLSLFLAGNITDLLNISIINHKDVNSALKVSSVGFPIILITVQLQAYLEGLEKFKELAIIKVITSTLLSILPLLFILINHSLKYAVIGLIFARLITLLIVYLYLYKDLKYYCYLKFEFVKAKKLFNYGGWLTLTNIVSPALTTVDRFILSSISGAEKVAMYTAPSEIINRLLIIPGILMRTIFPHLSKYNDVNLKKNINYLNVIFMAFICATIYFCSEQIISVWLGEKYIDSISTLKILSVGLFFCGIAQLPYTSIQAGGYSKIAAIIHITEVIPYLLLLYYLISKYSYNGAAIAWTIRVVIDALIFIFIYRKKYKYYINI